MDRKIVIPLLLCVATLFPSVTTAQFFEKQKVVVWEIYDRNNDVKVSSATKQQIQTSIVDAFVSSRNYEAFEGNLDDVKNKLSSRGLIPSPGDVAKVARELYNVDFVLFTTIRIMDRSNSYDEFKVNLSSELFSTETQKAERMAYVDMKSDPAAIPAACAKLLGDLLHETLRAPAPARETSSFSQPAQSSNSQPAYNQSPQPRTPQNFVENAGCGLNMKMIYVEGGSFRMGATAEQGSEAESDESPVHTVQLESFYIAECEVTQAQWEAVMGTTIYRQRDLVDASLPICGVGADVPMYYISWDEAQAFCRELSAMTGRTYILPTEVQWEYAARGGKHSKGYKYSGSYMVDAVAWYTQNSDSKVNPVKQKRANELGLYDMTGNLYEWCYDWYGSYSSSPQNNPTGPSSGEDRVIRGGSCFTFASGCRVSCRGRLSPADRNFLVGLRVVCLP
ncbi:MAG: formylglycine-generating enzyme family protein [Bacteroidales bacterium]|nr:formylglycine-generating enzyme family protein [Bacteroidales bacterium]